MSKISQMQGVSAHLEYLKSKDKTRRHPAHCIYHDGKGENRICNCDINKERFSLRCTSAKNCDYYKEK